MVVIYLSNGKEVLVDDEDYEVLSKFNWCDDGHGRAVCQMKDEHGKWRQVKMHRFITNCPKGKVVDHANGNPLDNRKINLRICIQKENLANARIPSHNTSGYKGVTYFKRDGRYRAYIKIDQKQYHLGYFNTKEEAAIAYNNKAAEVFGEFALLNNIHEGVL